MGRAVAHGSAWLVISSVATRAASFLAQILLGWLLFKNDFGIYALAMSVSSLAAVLRDGGVRQLLVQRHRDYPRLIGPVFWMAGAFNAATGLIIALLAPILAAAYHEPRVGWLMLVIAVSQPLGTPGAILTTRLQIDLRFREIGRIAVVSALVRYVGAVLLAWLGFGALSFVLPLPVLAVIEGAMAWAYTRERPWRLAPRLAEWWPMFRDTRWVIAGTFGIAGLNLGSNMVISFFVPLTVVGVYFFAFQIVMQIGMLLSANVYQVLTAAFARIVHDPERERAAAERALRQVMLVAAPMCLGLAATFYPVEMLIWKGKWADAADAVQVIGLLYPINIAASVVLAVIQARGRFRLWGLSLVGMALATLGGAALGAAIHGSAAGAALYSGLANAVTALLVAILGFSGLGLRPRHILGDIGPAWLIAIAAGAAAMSVDLYVLTSLQPPATPAGPSLILLSLIRAAIVSGVFCAAFAFLSRVLIPGHLKEALLVAPARLRPLAAGILWLGPGGLR